MQVWRGALILADFLVHHQSSSLLNSTYCIEIGCGVGLCGLVLARVAQRVFLTGMMSREKEGERERVARRTERVEGVRWCRFEFYIL